MIANDSNRLSQVQTPNCSRTPNLCLLSYISSITKRAENVLMIGNSEFASSEQKIACSKSDEPWKGQNQIAKCLQSDVAEWSGMEAE